MDEAAPKGASASQQRFRVFLFFLGVLTLIVSLVPPLSTEARRYEFVEAIQFSFLAVVVPALIVCGAQWRRLGLAGREAPVVNDDGAVVGGGTTCLFDRMAIRRRFDPSSISSFAVAILYSAVIIVWRVPTVVDQLQRHPWILWIEAVVLVGVGVAMWLELVESPPVIPRRPRPHRVAMAAVTMWVIWTMAYLVGLSGNSWYHGFDHLAGQGISVSADQQLSTGVMWLLSAAAFMPVVFWNLVQWLQQDEDPDDELYRLIRQERRGRTIDRSAGE